ncbi:MAG TPA: putative capsular polysaccharide synthesis family protein [Rhodothermales bacterium]|nr:putative capsular polysaccharide synthesis family protein [Rhodothermales bacterium]
MIEKIRIGLQDFSKHPPILVYQMGKVGSTTIYRSLQTAKLLNPVYHIHYLSPGNLEWDEQRFVLARQKKILEPKTLQHIQTGHLLRSKLLRQADAPLYIITGVREPVSWTLSSFFQNIHYFCPDLLDEDGRAREQDTLRYLQSMFARFDEKRDLASNWFDIEFKKFFDVDIYQVPFNCRKGYTILEHGRLHVLILRQEDLRRTLSGALREFLAIDQPIEVKESNVGTHKKHRQAYTFVKDNIRIPSEVCERIYSTKYVRHFYDENTIAGFVQKWRDRTAEYAT